MRNFQDTFEISKRSFINGLSICMTVPLSNCHDSSEIESNLKIINQVISDNLPPKFISIP